MSYVKKNVKLLSLLVAFLMMVASVMVMTIDAEAASVPAPTGLSAFQYKGYTVYAHWNCKAGKNYIYEVQARRNGSVVRNEVTGQQRYVINHSKRKGDKYTFRVRTLRRVKLRGRWYTDACSKWTRWSKPVTIR